jgi:hypothetical protein
MSKKPTVAVDAPEKFMHESPGSVPTPEMLENVPA